MISDVPLGAFLSGGVDSSAVVAIMAGLSDAPVNTCSIGFDDPKFNESEFAQKVADRYRTNHFVETVKSDDFDLIDTLAALYDEPYADSSAIPTYRVCQLARKHVTVALSGDGGDESFGGYRRYRMHLMEEKMRAALPHGGAAAGVRPARAGLSQGRLGAARVSRQDHLPGHGAGFGRGLLPFGIAAARGYARQRLFSGPFPPPAGWLRCARRFPPPRRCRLGTDDALALIQYLDLKTYLVGDINTKVDRASMAHSLEVREPLMDHELVEWLATLPSGLKIQGNEGKYLFKKAMEPYPAARGAVSPQDGLCRTPRALVPWSAQAARA
jgi:asparagine synthase (glutamine-hydrolysing)